MSFTGASSFLSSSGAGADAAGCLEVVFFVDAGAGSSLIS
jgi:hypothetical protein